MKPRGNNGPGPVRSWFRVHEGTLSLVWLGAVALFLLLLAFAPTRERMLGLVQDAIQWHDGRWEDAIAEGEALVRAGKYEEAVAYLTDLNARFPARTIRHGKDRGRERVMLLLAQSLAALDKKSKSMAVYQQLVDFDPRNFRNWYAMGVGADKLLSGWALAEEAKDAFAAALVINPSHLPSLRGVIRFYGEQGLYNELRAQYETYLDAFLAADVTFRTADSAITISIPVDGRFRDVELPLGQPAGELAVLAITPGGYPMEVVEAQFVPALEAGSPGRDRPVILPLAEAVAREGAVIEDGRVLPQGMAGTMVVKGPPSPGASKVRVRLRLLKPMDEGTWGTVSKAYHNLLDPDGAARALDRTQLFSSEEAADAVQTRQEWATEGLKDRPDETVF